MSVDHDDIDPLITMDRAHPRLFQGLEGLGFGTQAFLPAPQLARHRLVVLVCGKQLLDVAFGKVPRVLIQVELVFILWLKFAPVRDVPHRAQNNFPGLGLGYAVLKVVPARADVACSSERRNSNPSARFTP